MRGLSPSRRRLCQVGLRRDALPFDGAVDRGAAHAEELGPCRWAVNGVDGRHPVDVVITHAFTIGWLLRHALDAPAWRWFPPSQCHAGLTVIRYEVEGPPSVVVANDMAHLPAVLRWTGFPEHLRL